MRQPLMIRERQKDGTLGNPVKAFANDKTPEEILKDNNSRLEHELAKTNRTLLEFIEAMMMGGMKQ